MRLLLKNITETLSPGKIDLVDRKILYQISKNARSSLKEIAKFVHLSPESVKYRLNQLEEKAIFKGTRTAVDIKVLGYDSYHVFLKLNNPEEKEEKEFVDAVIKIPHVRAVLKLYGNFDFEIALVSKDVEEFDTVLTEIISKVKERVVFKDILLVSKTLLSRPLPISFYRDVKEQSGSSAYSRLSPRNISAPRLEEKDLDLLEAIKENARMPLTEISRKIGVSHDAAGYRLKKLLPLLSFVPVIDFASLGFNVSLLFVEVINLDAGKLAKINGFNQTDRNIIWMVKTLGRYNLLAYVCTRSQQDLHETITSFKRMFPQQIVSYEVMPAVVEYKYAYIPDCLFEKLARKSRKE